GLVLEQFEPGAEGAGEVDFAVHGAGGDGFDLLADAGQFGDVVEKFVLYEGHFHVGDKELFLARGAGLDRIIHAPLGGVDAGVQVAGGVREVKVQQGTGERCADGFAAAHGDKGG